MAFGNNRAGTQARASFRLAGGSTIKFKHPYLAGQISTDTDIDTIDISSCCKLEGRFFEANQNMDSAKQVVLVDGSVCTISNRIIAGTITMPIIKTTGLVATGDFIAACHIIKSIGDSVGGLLFKTDEINGKVITRCYYGVTVQRCPDDVSEGNDVAVYNVQLLYAGWIEAISGSSSDNTKKIWAVGTAQGLSAYFSSYNTQNADGNSGSGSSYLTSDLQGVGQAYADDVTAADNYAVKYTVNSDKTVKSTLSGATAYPNITGASTITAPTS